MGTRHGRAFDFTPYSHRNDLRTYILIVRAPDEQADADHRVAVEGLRRLAAVLGAHLLVASGSDAEEVVIRVAKERGTTYLPLGAPPPRRGLARLGESQLERLVRTLPGIDVRVVNDRQAARPCDELQAVRDAPAPQRAVKPDRLRLEDALRRGVADGRYGRPEPELAGERAEFTTPR